MYGTGTKRWLYPWLFLKSKRLAVVLITLIVFCSALGMVIPQIDPNPGNYQSWAVKYPQLAPIIESLGLNNLFRSWWFAVLGVTFFTNLAACTFQQVLQCLRIWRRRLLPLSSEPLAEFAAAGDYADVREAAVDVFGQAGYRTAGVTDHNLYIDKHRWGIWGSVLFHIGLIVVVFGCLLSGAVKTTGYMMLAEGETRREVQEDYDVIYRGPFFKNEDHYGFGITMQKQRKIYDAQGQPDYIISDLLISENGRPVLEKPVTRGEPLVYKDIRFFEYDDGFAPHVTLIKPDGSTAWQTFLLLNTHRSATYRTFYYNDLQLPGTPYTLSIEFYPDMAFKDKTTYNKSDRLNNPAAKAIIREKGRQIAEKVIKKSEPLIFNGYRFSFDEVRAWTGLEVVRDPGAGILFGGFWLSLAGLVVMYCLRYRKIQLSLTADGRMTLVKVFYHAGRHRKFLSDEIIFLADALKNKYDNKE